MDKVKDWYKSLPEEDKKLFMSLDFTNAIGIEGLEKEMEELREQTRIATAKTTAEELGVDSNAFDVYSDLLSRSNKELEHNSAEAAEAALANIRLNKGIEDLQKSLKNNVKALASGSKTTVEYAKALGEV
jgi:beta-phosphoglucomutase-like phosphatase (HAD superfamily)